MKLTITFPDNVAKKVCRLPNPDEFVSRVVEKALEQGGPLVRSWHGLPTLPSAPDKEPGPQVYPYIQAMSTPWSGSRSHRRMGLSAG